jgi:tetratricopeptide (TPR) repeat protein
VSPTLLALLLGIAVATSPPQESPTAPATAPASYVGAAVCTACHPTAAQAWSGSHHQRAMLPATAGTVRADFSGATFADAGMHARFFRDGDRFLIHTVGPDGRPADVPVAYVFGIDPLQQYLLPAAGGRLQTFTVAWDTRPARDGGQRWLNLYPGEPLPAGDPLHWTGADQTWNYMCASCHSTNLDKRYDAATDTYGTTWTDVDVACEACHGPGSEHVAWAHAATPGSPSTAHDGLPVHFPAAQLTRWVIDPTTGSARAGEGPVRAEIEICAPCHMRRTTIAAAHHPGEPLLDAYVPALLTEGAYFADGQIDGEVYEYGSFLQSRMYRAGVSCRDCHEPHALTLRAGGNALCTRCHLAAKYDAPSHHFHRAGSPGASCPACHMPARTYMRVDVRHDHSLRVPRPDLSLTLGTPNPCTGCHTERDPRWARDQVRAWYGHDPAGLQRYAQALHAGRTGQPGAVRPLADLIADRGQPAIARATALTLLTRSGDATPASVLATAIGEEDPIVRWAAAGALETLPLADRLRLGAPLLGDATRAVRIEAARQLAGAAPALAGPEVSARITAGLAEWVAAQRVDADRPEAHVNLCTLYGELGDVPSAERECRAAMRLRPSYTPAYVNLADVFRAADRDNDGERLLRDGLAAAPSDAALHHALGLLLVRAHRPDAALAELQRAAELRPADIRYAYVLGIALHAAGQSERALGVLAAAHDRSPTDRDILIALATINRDLGNAAAVQDYARQLAALSQNGIQR